MCLIPVTDTFMDTILKKSLKWFNGILLIN